ncbi:MAG: UDP-N-acetyl glucosamine 2-epimerase [Massilia sp.]|nr:UDP-N-acetyl glucosamine 2-epimerase [Massilia sp.]
MRAWPGEKADAWLFTPTDGAAADLLREGTDPARICPVGDVMYDVAGCSAGWLPSAGCGPGILSGNNPPCEKHRPPRPAGTIVEALAAFARDIPVVWPLHPRTREVLASQGKLEALARAVILVEPLGYLDMVQLEKYAALIATDSGGVQKEAFFHRVPCVTLRVETEWKELVEAGWNRIAPPLDAASVLAGPARQPRHRAQASRAVWQGGRRQPDPATPGRRSALRSGRQARPCAGSKGTLGAPEGLMPHQAIAGDWGIA